MNHYITKTNNVIDNKRKLKAVLKTVVIIIDVDMFITLFKKTKKQKHTLCTLSK